MQEWVEKGPTWAVDVLQTIKLERTYRQIETDCFRGLLK